jgi:hypothetical protein
VLSPLATLILPQPTSSPTRLLTRLAPLSSRTPQPASNKRDGL